MHSTCMYGHNLSSSLHAMYSVFGDTAVALAYAIGYAPKYAGRACNISSQRRRARAIGCFTILIGDHHMIYGSQSNNKKLLCSLNKVILVPILTP